MNACNSNGYHHTQKRMQLLPKEVFKIVCQEISLYEKKKTYYQRILLLVAEGRFRYADKG
jgi:hypothetical protein